MAYTKKKVADATTSETETVVEKEETIKESTSTKKKKFDNEDKIPCISITPGEMFFIGEKSDTLYTFADADDVVEIEYRDLKYAVDRKNPMVFKPRFIVQDADFLELYPKLEDLYSGLYSAKDLKDILKLPANSMKTAIESLPIGAQDALKHIAATMIDNGTLDSVQRIKVLDEIFDTEMLLRLQN